jgi:hypothetical protein
MGTVDIMPMGKEAQLSQVLTERPELALLMCRNACVFFAKHLRRMALTLSSTLAIWTGLETLTK